MAQKRTSQKRKSSSYQIGMGGSARNYSRPPQYDEYDRQEGYYEERPHRNSSSHRSTGGKKAVRRHEVVPILERKGTLWFMLLLTAVYVYLFIQVMKILNL